MNKKIALWLIFPFVLMGCGDSPDTIIQLFGLILALAALGVGIILIGLHRIRFLRQYLIVV